MIKGSTKHSIIRRNIINHLFLGLSSLSACVVLFFLFWIIKDLTLLGIASINFQFFTELPAPPGEEGGGMANAILGSILLTGTASIIAIPVGIMAGIYLSEYGGNNILARTTRFISDLFLSAPSIVVGVFIYTLLVKPMKSFSGIAGSLALSIIILPVVTRVTEEMLRIISNELRESAIALGASKWRVTSSIVLRSASIGITTGCLLAIGRIAGETAPLLFTSFNNSYWNFNPLKPTASIPVTVFNYAMSPYENWHQQAWAGAFIITVTVLFFTLLTKIISRRQRFYE